MTNEDQKNQNEQMSEDNLFNELDAFNNGSSSTEESAVETETQSAEESSEVQEAQADHRLNNGSLRTSLKMMLKDKNNLLKLTNSSNQNQIRKEMNGTLKKISLKS